ncbi:MAG TPA: peptidoglycan-associated lipoprotein Pal [Candidatus Acidoferrales bacterium]|nr:peptidoglycan-associated lipoprotein Pal [Candidatus Acidoferrales bacterium]
MRKRKHSKVLFGSLLVILACSAACKKPVPQAPAPPPPTPAAPPARPTVDLQASTTIIQRGESVTLTWTSTNATSLSLSPGIGNVPAEGTQRVTPQDSTTYTISATGPGGSADANVRITVSAPAPPAARSSEPTMQQLFEREVKDAYFDYDKADIRTDARDNLSQTAQFLRSYPQVKIVIEGHCDERGSTEYNLALGDRRAAAAKQFLASLGISADRMETVSYGKERPFCTASNEACYTQNRRAHIVMGK